MLMLSICGRQNSSHFESKLKMPQSVDCIGQGATQRRNNESGGTCICMQIAQRIFGGLNRNAVVLMSEETTVRKCLALLL